MKFINLLLVQKKANEFLFIIISISETLMSRGNVFRLSGNMALGGSDYGGNDINEIKNSLKLLKAKKNQKQSIQEQYNNNYGNQISAKNSKTDYNYDATKKNSTTAIDYQKKSFGTEYRQNTGTTQTYDYSTKPPSYPQSNNNRNSRNMQSMHRPQNCQSSHNIYTEKSNTQQRNQNIQSTKAQQASQQPRRQDQFYNEREQKSIKQVNRQNQVQIGVVEYDPSQLRPCRVCDRKFNPDSIVKHEANCQKVFQKKRKEFNAQQHRLVDNQQKKLMKKGELVQKKIQAQQKNQKIPKWKAESLAFRNALKQNKNEPMDPKQAAMMKQVQNETGVKCPHCGRKFNDTAGPRHIKFCQEQARKNSMRRK